MMGIESSQLGEGGEDLYSSQLTSMTVNQLLSTPVTIDMDTPEPDHGLNAQPKISLGKFTACF